MCIGMRCESVFRVCVDSHSIVSAGFCRFRRIIDAAQYVRIFVSAGQLVCHVSIGFGIFTLDRVNLTPFLAGSAVDGKQMWPGRPSSSLMSVLLIGKKGECVSDDFTRIIYSCLPSINVWMRKPNWLVVCGTRGGLL